MASFSYVVLNRSGRQVKGNLDAASLDSAKKSLRATGYTILEIKELNVLNRDIDLPFLGNPTSKDMAIFCRQFQSILRAGVPVSTVLSMLGQQTENKKLAAAIRDMQASIETGETLAGSMRKHPRIFTGMLVNMVAAGEESGNLEDAFRQMEVWFDKAKRTKAAVSKVMVYPCILLTVMVAVLVLMMVKIIPQFLQTFRELDIELPAITRAVMSVSDWFVDWWWLLGIVVVGLVVGMSFFRKTDPGKHFFGWLARVIPVVKELTVRAASATFCRTLALLLGSGIPITEAMGLVALNMKNIYFREAVYTVRTMISEGATLNAGLRETGLFPPMVYNLTGIGEQTGDLQGMLSKTADYYDDEVENTTQRLLSLMEPFIILVLAVFVIILVLSILMPMMSMTTAYDSYL